jgi:hypothetical protein
LARAYFEHRKAISKIHPRYRFLCPTECEKGGFNPKRLKKCEGCALYAPEKEFRSKVLKAWKRKLRRHDFGFGRQAEVGDFSQELPDIKRVPERKELFGSERRSRGVDEAKQWAMKSN